jgi:hypothetical protein
MTPELQKYYDAYFDLFMTDGWKQFLADVKESAEVFNVRNVADEPTLKFVQGQLAVMDKLLNWEVSVEAAYNQANEEEETEE